jgi:cell filamentation protein
MPNYTLPDSETVKNKLGAHSHDELESLEVGAVVARHTEHLLDPRIPPTFDTAHLKAIHRQLFQDVYEWSGHTRDERVALSDGTIATEPLLYRPGSKPFASGAQISEGLESLSTRLREADYLRGLPRGEFATRAASVLATVNGIHAFQRQRANAKNLHAGACGRRRT